MLLLSLCVLVIRVGGVGGFAPLGPEGSPLVAPHTYTNTVGHGGAPAPSTSANSHTLGVD